jgi:hypothetical protein
MNSELAVEGFDPLDGSLLWTASDRGGAQFDRASMLREILSGFARQLVEITGGTLDAQAAVYAGTKGGSGYRIGSVHKQQAFGINDYQGIVTSFVHDAAMQLGGIPDELRDAIAGISWTNLPGAFEHLQREVLRIRALETAEAAPVGPARTTIPQATSSADPAAIPVTALAAPAPVRSAANDNRLLTRIEALTEEVRALQADNERLTGILAAVIADGAYTYSGAHEYFDSVAPAVVGTPVTLTGKSVTNGIFAAADATFTAVAGPTVEALVIYQWTGIPATSRLIAYIDTAIGLPFTPHGGNVLVPWDAGPNRIFAI